MSSAKASFNWADPLLLDQQLTEDERMVRESAASYCQDKLAPRVVQAFRNETTDASIFREMGALGLLGSTPVPRCDRFACHACAASMIPTCGHCPSAVCFMRPSTGDLYR